jgi:hypothetical protein
MGGFLASAAPKALGAGIGTLLAGGSSSDALMNAVGFGGGGALLQQGIGSFGAEGAATAAAEGAAPSAGPNIPQGLRQVGEMLQGQQEPQAVAPSVYQDPQGAMTTSPRPQPRPMGTEGGTLQQGLLGGPPQSVGQQAIAQSPFAAPSTVPAGLASMPGYVDPSMIAQAASPQNPMAAQQMFQNRGMIA